MKNEKEENRDMNLLKLGLGMLLGLVFIIFTGIIGILILAFFIGLFI